MSTLFETLRHYNDLNMTEGMSATVHSQFYGRKISYEAVFYLPEILCKFLDKKISRDVPLIAPVIIVLVKYICKKVPHHRCLNRVLNTPLPVDDC